MLKIISTSNIFGFQPFSNEVLYTMHHTSAVASVASGVNSSSAVPPRVALVGCLVLGPALLLSSHTSNSNLPKHSLHTCWFKLTGPIFLRGRTITQDNVVKQARVGVSATYAYDLKVE